MKEKKVNINTADEAELEKVKGVGKNIARRIVEYRKEHGPLQGSEDLRAILGEGATYSRLEDSFVFEMDESLMSKREEAFLKEAALSNFLEIRMGEIAAEKGSTQEVKDMGRRLKKDHSSFLKEMKRFAEEEGIGIPENIDGKHSRLIEKISKRSGEEFDRMFVETIVQEHEKEVKKFSEKSEEIEHPQLQEIVSRTLPKLEQHLEHARKVRERLHP